MRIMKIISFTSKSHFIPIKFPTIVFFPQFMFIHVESCSILRYLREKNQENPRISRMSSRFLRSAVVRATQQRTMYENPYINRFKARSKVSQDFHKKVSQQSIKSTKFSVLDDRNHWTLRQRAPAPCPHRRLRQNSACSRTNAPRCCLSQVH